ncbi:hypothetical protein F66182_2220 [Fusarium sp. NRRL 66182]|nr:hypothetical protein F66182_2220 [Fusarium sp. NRRL 66182]
MLKDAIRYFPNLISILVDGQGDLDPSEFLIEAARQVLVLSMADCPLSLSGKLAPCLDRVVYLDLSRIKGSFRPFLQHGQRRALRVLKIQGKEIDDAGARLLAQHFGTCLWSLDLGDNKLTDQALEYIGAWCLSPGDLRSDANFDIEGKLECGSRSPDYGPWVYVSESSWSGSFSHPNRHLIDAPSYSFDDTLPQEDESTRLDGKGPIKSDSADAVSRGLQGEDPRFSPATFQNSKGLTHLNLSDNQISSLGIRKLLTLGRGHLQQFSCDSMLLVPPFKKTVGWWPKTAKLYGFFAAHTLRPVFSSNLRVIRLHHSLVTQTPTLEMEGLSAMACCFISENSILPRAEKAFPEAFVPDMNPRITSLTLTRIPRRSSGLLVQKLISFLELLAVQERAIFDATSRRGPSTLAGLRHLRLEFEPDPCGEYSSVVEDIDAEELMNSGEKGFSFFQDEAKKPRLQPARGTAESSHQPDLVDPPLPQGGSGQRHPEYLSIGIAKNGKSVKTNVWIGPFPTDNLVIRDYRRLVQHYQVRDHIGPATPAQILAGAPPAALVFHTAWCMAMMPQDIKEPTRCELGTMRDVLTELKRFRLEGKARHLRLQTEYGSKTVPPGEPHGFWLGKLEVSTQRAGPSSKSANYWR